MNNYFDFGKTSREFSQLINKEEDNKWYQIDAKTLQLRWTDIEIRNYRMN